MRIRARTFRDWVRANFTKGQLRELLRDGIEAGWPGLTHYSETSALYERFAAEIWDIIADQAEEAGTDVWDFITRDGRTKPVTPEQFAWAMVTAAAEIVAWQEVGEG